MLLAVAVLASAGLWWRHQQSQSKRKRAAAARYDIEYANEDEPWFETQIFIEDEDLSCDFTMRVEYAELSSRELLLECIARAAFEATEFSFDFSTACLEILGTHGSATSFVRTDADCRRISDDADEISGLRVTTGKSVLLPGHGPKVAARTAATAEVGSLLYADLEDDDEPVEHLIL